MAKIKKVQDEFTRTWIIEHALEIIKRYKPGELTIRALHYQLVGDGMTNTMQHYRRVVGAMELARWGGDVPFGTFSDLDREMVGETRAEETDVYEQIELAKEQIQSWMDFYSKNRWENQPIYTELFIEKKALQNVFQSVCRNNNVALGCCKGYPSLTFLHETAKRLKKYHRDKECIILYFGDYDPSGENIPVSVEENLRKMGCDVEVRRFALFREQVEEWDLPPAPAKEGDPRTANWTGIGQVELDAVKPEKLKEMAQEAINSVFDASLHADLLEIEENELEIYQQALKKYASEL